MNSHDARDELNTHARFYAVLMGGSLEAGLPPADSPLGRVTALAAAGELTEQHFLDIWLENDALREGQDPSDV